jgi:hypothetical protein
MRAEHEVPLLVIRCAWLTGRLLGRIHEIFGDSLALEIINSTGASHLLANGIPG